MGFDSSINNAIKYLKSYDSEKWNDLIKLIKKTNNANPYDYDKEKDNFYMWEEQCNINFPILYLASIYLFIYAKKRNCDTFLFATRDCCNWYKIFHGLFPNENAHYFHCSRNMFETATANNNPAFRKYVKSLINSNINQTIYIDVHGTGKRVFTYFEKEFKMVPNCLLLSATYKDYSDFPPISKYYKEKRKFCNLVFDASGGPIEMLNYDVIGTLQNYTPKGPIRDELEYSLNLVEPYHECVEYIVNHLDELYLSDDIERKYDLEDLNKIIQKIFKCIRRTKPSISRFIRHIGKHRKNRNNLDPEGNPSQFIRYDNNLLVKSNKPVLTRSINKGIIQNFKNNDDNLENGENIKYKGDNPEDINKNNKILSRLNFDQILSKHTTYGLIWKGTFDNKICVVKMVMLTSGVCSNNSDSINKYFNHNDKAPFRHREFKNRKAMSREAFLNEAKEITFLNHIGLAPKVYGYWICDDMYDVHYGFLVMQKMDYSLKHILLKRPLNKSENKLVNDMIDTMHDKFGVVHRDLKPSNIGVNIDKHGEVVKCLVFDCQKVKHKENVSSREFNRMVKSDWNVYNRHTLKNREEGKEKN